jgi:hypothetical protein
MPSRSWSQQRGRSHDLPVAICRAITLGVWLPTHDGSGVTVRHVPVMAGGVLRCLYADHRARKSIALGQNNFRVDPECGIVGLSVRCADGKGGGSTTYDLRFVDVPTTLRASKQVRGPVTIEIERVSGRAAVRALR